MTWAKGKASATEPGRWPITLFFFLKNLCILPWNNISIFCLLGCWEKQVKGKMCKQDHICTKKEKVHPYCLLFILLYSCWIVDMVTIVEQIQSQSKKNNMLRMAEWTNSRGASPDSIAEQLHWSCTIFLWAPCKVRKIYPYIPIGYLY